MSRILHCYRGFAALLCLFMAVPAVASSFRVQCPPTTNLHPNAPTLDAAGNPVADPAHPGFVKCQEISGTDGFATMGDGNQIYLFGFGPLSGKQAIESGLPGTQAASVFNNPASPNAGSTEPADIMNKGILAANAPAPMMSIDEDDELFLTLSNVGMIMRPDLFEQHTVHFHGYPNASSFFDGVPDASAAINIAGSFTYYYTAPDAGTYFFHCHITPPEHLQMGMVGQLFVRPRQNRAAAGQDLGVVLKTANKNNPGADGIACSDILCTGQTPLPSGANAASGSSGVLQPVGGAKYAYNDGDGSTRYDVEYPIQLMGFDPNFHYVGMTFNPEAFVDMKDKYFMISGRSYPDTVNPGPINTLGADGVSRNSQPQATQIKLTQGQRALLRISDLNITEFHTLSTVGIPMLVIAEDARLLRDMAGNNLYYTTNSITMGGGESKDVILDASNVPPGTYFLYTTNLDHLSNDAENFGGMMTEIVVN
jgi:FtsP/CotA-like multicopper oxidase with cupredoxin domain